MDRGHHVTRSIAPIACSPQSRQSVGVGFGPHSTPLHGEPILMLGDSHVLSYFYSLSIGRLIKDDADLMISPTPRPRIATPRPATRNLPSSSAAITADAAARSSAMTIRRTLFPSISTHGSILKEPRTVLAIPASTTIVPGKSRGSVAATAPTQGTGSSPPRLLLVCQGRMALSVTAVLLLVS